MQTLKKSVPQTETRIGGSVTDISFALEKVMLIAEKSNIFISPSEIIRIEALQRKTLFVLDSNRKIETNRAIGDLEKILSRFHFFRPHRTHLINLGKVKEYITAKSGGCIVMGDGKLVPLSVQKKNEFLQQFL